MKDPQDIVKSILVTEKGTNISPQNKYLFVVDKSANKIQIKNAIEQIYKVKVKNVHTMVMPGKKRRIRYVEGRKPDWKKAIVKLKTGHRIELK